MAFVFPDKDKGRKALINRKVSQLRGEQNVGHISLHGLLSCMDSLSIRDISFVVVIQVIVFRDYKTFSVLTLKAAKRT